MHYKKKYTVFFLLFFAPFYNYGYDYDLVLVGGGALSMTLAKKVRSYGKKVLLVQPPLKNYTFLGFAFPLLLELAHFYLQSSRSLKEYSVFTNFVSLKEKIEFAAEKTRDSIIFDNVSYFEGIATIIDNHTLEYDGLFVSFDKLIVFPEFSSPVFDNQNEPYKITPENLFNFKTIPESVVVVDRGFFSLEFATVLHLLGSKVTYITNKKTVISSRLYEFERIYKTFLNERDIKYYCSSEITAIERTQDGIKVIGIKEGFSFEVEASHILYTTQPEISFNHIKGEKINIDDISTIKNFFLFSNSLLKYVDYDDPAYMQGIFKIREFLELLKYDVHNNRFKAHEFFKKITIFYTVPLMVHIGMTEQEAFETYGTKIKVFKEFLDFTEQFHLESCTKGFMKVVCLQTGQILGITIVSEKALEILENISFEKPLQAFYYQGMTESGTMWTYLDIIERMGYQSFFTLKLCNNENNSWWQRIKQWL